MIKQRHSFHRLLYHLVFTTKNGMDVIRTKQDEAELVGLFKKKADDLDAYVEEFGSWFNHVHLLVRSSPALALSNLYGRLKGFASRGWNLKHPDRMLAWSDGVFAATVDPEENEELRVYIRNQRLHHEKKTKVARWEHDDD